MMARQSLLKIGFAEVTLSLLGCFLLFAPASGWATGMADDGKLDFSSRAGVYQFYAATDEWRRIVDFRARTFDRQRLFHLLTPFLDTLLLYDSNMEAEPGEWRSECALLGADKNPFPARALIAAKGVNLFIYDTDGLKLWGQFRLGAPGIARPKTTRIMARGGKLYLLVDSGSMTTLYLLDFGKGVAHRWRSGGGYAKAALPPFELRREMVFDEQQGFSASWRKLYDLYPLLVDGKKEMALAAGGEGIYLLAEKSGGDNKLITLPKSGDEALAVAVKGERLYAVLRDEKQNCRCLSYEALGDGGFLEIAALPPCDYARIDLDREAQGKLLVHTNGGRLEIGLRGEERGLVRYLLRGYGSPELRMQLRGRLRAPLEPPGMGLSGWSSDSYLAAPELSFRGGFSSGFWIYLDGPQPDCVLLDNLHGAENGWVIGIMNKKYLFIHVGGRPSKGFASRALLYGKWHHVVLVNDGRQMVLYLDGYRHRVGEGLPVSPSRGFSIGRRLVEGDERSAAASTIILRPFFSRKILGAGGIFNLYQVERALLETKSARKFADLEQLEKTSGIQLAGSPAPANNPLKVWYKKHAVYLFIAGAGIVLSLVLGWLGRLPRDKWLFYLAAVAIPLCLLVYGDGFRQPFRSDMYLAYSLFNRLSLNWQGLLAASRFEMFGHRRIMPLSHIIMFLQQALLGVNHFYHHLLQFGLHVLNTLLLYLFLRELLEQKVIAFIAAVSFLYFYSQFDIINWTYHSFLVMACTAFLLSFYLLHKYTRQRRGWYLAIALAGLFYTQLVYEANFFFPLLELVFLKALLRRRAVTSGQGNGQALRWFTRGVIVCYVFFICFFFYELNRQAQGTATVQDAGEMRMSRIFSPGNIGQSLLLSAKLLSEHIGIKAFGFPSGISIKDILYLNETRFEPGKPTFYIASAALFVFLLSLTEIRKQDLKLAGIVFLCLLSHAFIISLGRGDYALTQARYAYMPNMLFAIITALLIRGKVHSSKGYQWAVLGAALTAAALNAVKIQRDTLKTSDALYELGKYVAEVGDFAGQKAGSLFVDFPLVQRAQKFNLGSDVALDVYFGKQGLLSKNIRQAAYIYERERGIHKNPLYKRKTVAADDFTIEFLLYQIFPHNLTNFSVVEDPGGSFALSISRDSRIIFSGTWVKNGQRLKREFAVAGKIEKGRWIHVVSQRQGDKFYLLVDGEIALVENVEDYRLETGPADSSLIGSFYRGSGSSSFVNQLFVCFGKAKYRLQGKKRGEKVLTEWIQPW